MKKNLIYFAFALMLAPVAEAQSSYCAKVLSEGLFSVSIEMTTAPTVYKITVNDPRIFPSPGIYTCQGTQFSNDGQVLSGYGCTGGGPAYPQQVSVYVNESYKLASYLDNAEIFDVEGLVCR